MAPPSRPAAQAAHTAQRFEASAMKPYGNQSGDSGVAAYECRPGEIRLKFVDRETIYVYTRVRPGAEHVREMQRLAKSGDGLATYVNQHVRDDYEYSIG